MYIACPECNTKFIVTAEQIGSQGRKVKCSKCINIWHQTLDNNLKIEPRISPITIESTPLGNGINLPALVPIKISPFLYGLPIILISMIILMLITLFPNMLGIKSILDQKNLGIKDLQITHNKELSKIIVVYKVLNSSDKIIQMPLVRIRLLDENDRVIKSKIDNYTRIELAPSQNVNISTEFAPIPDGVISTDIMLGNKLDFFLR